MYKKLQDGEGEVKEISFGPNSERLKQDYLDIFEGFRLDVIHTDKYNENSEIGTTYLGTSKLRRQDDLKAEHKVPITEDCYIPDKLMDGTYCNILLDMEAKKSFMSKTYYLNCTSVHSSPKCISRAKNILLSNGQYVDVLFIIPVVIKYMWTQI